MFTAQEEQILGDVVAQSIERQYEIIRRPSADDYLEKVGARLLATLPPSDLKYSFQVYESADMDAFGIAGGRVYISTKLIALLKDEDELAALLAHEIGHIATHQQAMDFTVQFHQIGVREVHDRDDIERDFLKWMATPTKTKNKEERDQMVADRVAVFALARAGYRATAFAEMYDRLTANQGKKGNALLDLLGMTTEDTRRYREAATLAAAVPASCFGKPQADPAGFATWQRSIAERGDELAHEKEAAPESNALQLATPLGTNLHNIRFSPNGKYLLAQDAATVTVMQNEPLKVLFQIPAAHIAFAQFSPDSQAVSFSTSSLKVERWDVATQKRTALHEVIYPQGCAAQYLSPDGATLVCVTAALVTSGLQEGDPMIGITLLDTETSKVIWEKKKLYVVDYYMSQRALVNLLNGISEYKLVTAAQSPDGRVVLLGGADKTIAIDLAQREQMEVQGGLKHVGLGHLAFVGNDRVIVENRSNPADSAIYSWPEGKLLVHVKLGDQDLGAVTHGDAAILWPIKGAAAGLLDLKLSKIVASSDTDAMDLYDTIVARQTPTGNVQLDDLANTTAKAQIAVIPRHKLTYVEAGTLSPDGRYLSISTASRSAIWDLKSNSRVAMMRPYGDAWFDATGKMYADFSKFGGSPRTVGIIDMASKQGRSTGVVPEDKALVAAGVIALWTTGKPDNNGVVGGKLDVRRATDNTPLWTRDFPQGLGGYTVTASDKNIVLWWHMESPAGQAESRAHPEWKVGKAKNAEGLLIELVDRETGKLMRGGVIEHQQADRNLSFAIRCMGDLIIVYGNDGRTVVYRLSDGDRSAEFIGEVIALEPSHGWLAATNRDNEIAVRDGETGKVLLHRMFGSAVLFAAFARDSDTLYLLTADETVHRIPVGSQDANQQFAQ